MKTYEVGITFTEQLLASSPANPEVYKEFIASRARDESTADEVQTLPAAEKEKTGWSVFHRDETGLHIYEYHIKGFLKEAATAITGKGISAIKSKIDRWVFIRPRRLYLMNGDGGNILQPVSNLERPIRVMTMQGPRTSVKRSEYVEKGTNLKCAIDVLDLGEKEITPAVLESWLRYGARQGLGEWRNAGYGRFEAKVVEQS